MRRTSVCLYLPLLLLAGLFDSSAISQSRSENTAFVGAKIYASPTQAPILDGTVLIRNGKILSVGERKNVKVPPNSRIIDCSGLILTAAFWNSHVHFTEPNWQDAEGLPARQLGQQVEAMLTRYGFTHVVDTGSFLESTLAIRRRIESGNVPGPSILTAGMPFVAPQGSPFYIAPLKLPELSTPQEAAKAVRERITSGADAIKIFAASPVLPGKPPVTMPVAVAKAVVRTAHALSKPVIAHPTNTEGIKVVLAAGVDILAHTTPDGGEPWSEELARELKSAGVALVPTLKLWKFELERKGAPPTVVESFLKIALQQLSIYLRARGEILFGTDVGYMTDYDPTDEYVFMQKAGMKFEQILASLTTAPSARFGFSDRTGRIAPGLDADLLLLGADPASDIKALANVKYTMRRGQVIYKSK